MPQAFEATDLLLHQTVSDIQCSYEEGLAACSVSSLQREQDSATSSLWIFPADGSPAWQMTRGVSSDICPRWSPDGQQLAFISDRAGDNQVFVIARAGGEARQVSRIDGQAAGFEWTADGKSVLVTAALRVDPNLRGARAQPGAALPPENGPQVIWRLGYKADGLGYTLDREIHLFRVDVASGEARQLTDGPFNVRSAQASVDGRRIVYSRTREADEAHRSDVWVMDSDGQGARQLTHGHAQVLFPRFSPDGRWIVFCGTLAEGDAQVRPWLIETATGEVRPLGDDSIEISTEGDNLQFVGQDSARVLGIVARRGVQEIVEISVPEGQVTLRMGGERQLSQLACARDFLVYAAHSPVQPMEVHRCRADASDEKCLSSLNAWWQDRPRASFERRQFEVPDGSGGTEVIDGWLIRPAGAKGATPLLLEVHGGPAGFVPFAYGPIAYWSMLWSQGWSILALNAVGSASYGREFSDRLRGRWGELDLPQHLCAVQTLQGEGLADERVAVAGKSYGGYLACWAVGHTEVFRAAVAAAPISQIEAHWGSSDSGYYSDAYAMRSDQDVALMRRLSPLEYLRGARIPTLLLQGAEDERCPRAQAEAAFVALRRGGNRDCEMVIYPQCGHQFTAQGRPSQRMDAIQRIVDWVTRWTQ